MSKPIQTSSNVVREIRDQNASALVPFIFLTERKSVRVRIVRASFVVATILTLAIAGLFVPLTLHTELKAAELSKVATAMDMSSKAVLPSKPTRLRGKNVSAEPSGIALSGDSKDASSLDELENAVSSPKAKKAAKPVKPAPRIKAKRNPEPSVVVREPKAPASNGLLDEAEKRFEDGDYAGAIALYDKALEKDANDQAAWAGKAFALQQSGKVEAVDELHKMTVLRPFSGVAYEALAHAFLNQGDNKAALLSLQRAVELEPLNRDYRLSLAVLHDRLGHDAEALALYKQLKAPLPYAAQKRLDYLSKRVAPSN